MNLTSRVPADTTGSGVIGSGATGDAVPVLRINDLSVGYERRGRPLAVLEHLSMSVRRGEALGIIGESGCGKTTLAAAIMRYLPKRGRVLGGTVEVDGEDMLTLPEERLRTLRASRIALVSQDPGSALNPSMRIGQQLAEVYLARPDGPRGDALERSRELLARVALPDPGTIMRRYPHEMSGGQQQRVLIAMALAKEPDLLLLDEPTTGLDTIVEAEVMDLVRGLHQELDSAIVFISHNLGLVADMCERIGVLYSGRLVEIGGSADVVAAPRHPYTESLLRCLPSARTDKRTNPVAPIPGAVPDPAHRPSGCQFAPRCDLRQDACAESEPELVAVDGDRPAGHLTRCRRWELLPTPVAQVPVAQVPGPRPEASPAGPADGAAADGVAADGGAEALLRLTAVSKRYRDTVALDDVSLEIHRGETFGLVGQSGSGKSTLAWSIAGLVEPDAGTIAFGGQAVPWAIRRRPKELLRQVQMVFQHPDSTLNPRHTIRRTLGRAIAKLRGGTTSEELARSVQLPLPLLDERPAGLSGGQKQRVAIGRAFADPPQLVICDEPVSALDASVQAGVLALLDRLQREAGTSYLFISHDLGVVRYLADRLGVMYLGQLVEIGSSRDVFDGPHHPYTEALLSAVPTLSGRTPHGRLIGTVTTGTAAGCRFADRCPRAVGGLCEVAAPPWREAGRGHRIRCHLSLAELRGA